jgi:hypothetical protein
MVTRMCVFTAIALGLAPTKAPRADLPPASPKAVKLLQKKLEAARTAFKEVWPSQWGDVEVPYRWSCRWLKAERELSPKTEDHVAALQAHAERMRELERVVKGLHRRRLATLEQVRSAEFYVAEAEAWLGQANE